MPRRRTAIFAPHRGLGDLMWHLPYLRAIAAGEAGGKAILIARASSHAESLLTQEACFSEIVETAYPRGPGRRRAETALLYDLFKRLRLDRLWILDKLGRAAFAAFAAGVRDRRGFGHQGQWIWLSAGPKLPNAMRQSHQLEKLAAFTTAWGFGRIDPEPRLVAPDGAWDALVRRHAACPRPWVSIGIGSVDQDRCWAPDRFAVILARIGALGGTAFLVGGPGDVERAKAILDAAAALTGPARLNGPIDTTGPTPVVDMAGLIARCDVFFGNDSGPLNLAAALGQPAIGLYGIYPPVTNAKSLIPVTPQCAAKTMAAIDVETAWAPIAAALKGA